MTTYTLAVAAGQGTFSQISNESTFTSLSGAIQSSVRTGNRFGLHMVWVRKEPTYMTVVAAILQLNGTQHRLKVPVAKGTHYTRQGVGGGTPLVSGAHNAGTNTLALRGLPANTTGILQPGDYITIGNQLCVVTSILSSTGSPNTRGSCTIWPELHANKADGATVDYATPYGIFYLASAGDHGMDHAGIGTFACDFVQDVLA